MWYSVPPSRPLTMLSANSHQLVATSRITSAVGSHLVHTQWQLLDINAWPLWASLVLSFLWVRQGCHWVCFTAQHLSAEPCFHPFPFLPFAGANSKDELPTICCIFHCFRLCFPENPTSNWFLLHEVCRKIYGFEDWKLQIIILSLPLTYVNLGQQSHISQ